MVEIYSEVKKGLLLHIIWRKDDFNNMESFRKDLIAPDNFIQCSALNMEKGKTFKPHKHIYKTRTWDDVIAQESWVVIQGRVRCTFYDIDGTMIARPMLEQGDASFTLHGGHTYKALDDNTIVYEYKTGKYEGQEFDKTFI